MNGLADIKKRWLGVAIAVVLPTLVTWSYFVLLAGSLPALQQGTYSVAKIFQFAFPVLWILFLLKRPLRSAGIASLELDGSQKTWTSAQSIGFGVAMGTAVVALMFVIYRFGFPAPVLEKLTGQAADRIEGFSIDSWQKYLGLSVFYALVHSLLEEYYYRWFVFGQLRHVTNLWSAIVISGLAFMGHHVIVLSHYFGGLTPLTLFLSFSIAIGGMLWAGQYEKSRSLLGPWLSHLLVDAGIFAIGYVVLRSAEAI